MCKLRVVQVSAVLSALMVFLLGSLVPANPDGQPLSGWALCSTQTCADSGEQISRVDYTPHGWMPAVVPGTTLTSYVRNGLYPEPYYDLNNKMSKGLIPDASVPNSVFTYPHWYKTTFTLDNSYHSKTIWLDFNGINYKASIFLNGQHIGDMAGMFKRGMFNVTRTAEVGRNGLAVEIFPVTVPGTPHTYGCGGDGRIGQNAATMYATIGWNYTLVDGVRDRNMGIYRSLVVSKTGPVRVRDPFMSTEHIPKPGQSGPAALRFQTTLINATDKTVAGTLNLDLHGQDGDLIPVSQPVTLQPHETQAVTLDSADHPGLLIKHPRLWWPVHQGAPALYGLEVSFVPSGGSVSDTVQTRFGIRIIVRDTSFHGQNTFWVNGRRTFIQGGNWVQDEMLRAMPQSYEAQQHQFADAGLNMLRCWSAAAPESDTFFDLCDKYGIMAWVESGGAAQVWGTTDAKMQLDNWADAIIRIRNHPSVAYYCGANEGQPIKGTAEVTAQYDPTRQYQDSSQDNGQRGCPYRYLGVNTLYDYTAKDLYGSGPLGPMAGFCNESGQPALPPADILRGMIAPQNLWPTQNNPGFTEAMKYQDGGDHLFILPFINSGCAEFGSFDQPDLAGRVGVDNYAFKGQILGAMTFRAMSEVWKRNKWDTAHGRFDTGYMLWTANAANPMVASKLTTYGGEPNAALFYYAHGNKPVHAQYDYFANDITLINDTAAPIPGLRVRAEIRNLDWSLKWSSEQTTSVEADTSLENLIAVPAKDTPGFDTVHFIVVTLSDAQGKLIDSALYWRSADGQKYGADGPFLALNTMPMARLSVKTSSRIVGEREWVTVHLTNPTTALAFFTRLKIYRGRSQTLVQPCHYADNYFSLAPGESREVTLDYDVTDLQGERPELVMEGWNLKTRHIEINGK